MLWVHYITIKIFITKNNHEYRIIILKYTLTNKWVKKYLKL